METNSDISCEFLTNISKKHTRIENVIALFTDFGMTGPYVGQMKAVFANQSYHVTVIDLMHDAPAFNPLASSYLLAATVRYLPEEMIVVAVVDPGVGSHRKGVALLADGRWFVGPDNGLLDVVAMQSDSFEWYEIIVNNKQQISTSFHGRDIFAPIALQLFNREPIGSLLTLMPSKTCQVESDLGEVIYSDGFGNLMTGLRAVSVSSNSHLLFKNKTLSRYTTFSDAAPGDAFFYENSQGLIEIAVNAGSAKEFFNAAIGDEIIITD